MTTLFAFGMPGPMEMVVIMVVAVLLFGRRLPKIAYDMGNSFTQFKKGLAEPIEDMRNEIERETRTIGRDIERETRECEHSARQS